MAVYERTYRPYTGTLTAEKGRFLVLPRYAFQEVLKSRIFAGFLVACFIWPLALALIIYLPHNLSFLKSIQAQAGDLLQIFRYDAGFFFNWFMPAQSGLAFLMAFIVGPALISADLRNNGLPLYLSREFTRTEYVLGKMSVLVILLSAITWIPGLLLFLLQSYFGGMEWIGDNFRIGPAIFISSCAWILVLCLLSLALSAYAQWKFLARLSLVVVVWVVPLFAAMLNVMLGTSWGDVIAVANMYHVVQAGLFGVESAIAVPFWAACLSLLAVCGLSLGILARKLRAYAVVR